jgi:predicted Rossmann fold nucleotide-binding protein DprA/Smf involved in DNA uptake
VDVLESAGGPLQIDELAERAGLEVQDILVQLLTLEFKSVVRQMAGKQFMLVR